MYVLRGAQHVQIVTHTLAMAIKSKRIQSMLLSSAKFHNVI